MANQDLILTKVYNFDNISISSEIGMNPSNGDYNIQVKFNIFHKQVDHFTLQTILFEVNEFVQVKNYILLLKNEFKCGDNEHEKVTPEVVIEEEEINYFEIGKYIFIYSPDDNQLKILS